MLNMGHKSTLSSCQAPRSDILSVLKGVLFCPAVG